MQRRLSSGAELSVEGTHFRVFAPKRQRVEVVFDDKRSIELTREDDGFFGGLAADMRAGARYRLRVDAGEMYPDPSSRFQPDGPHGASVIVDPAAFRWTDATWPGIELRGQVIYEMHVGTFTKAGTLASAIEELAELRAVGITVIEVMPLAEFSGRFGWGYDGTGLYAPSHLYGAPDDLRRFVDRAHAIGLGVILDVVYNHLGPDGNYLSQFSDQYFTDKYENDWGAAIDFETEPGARAYFVDNAAYWIDEFHFDGLRLDATQNIEDSSPKHVIAEIGERARAAAKGRSIILVSENEPQNTRLVRSGFGLDALWNDDFHHSAHVAVTGRREAYYSSTKGTPQELVSAIKWGYLFQGQYYPWQKERRGAPALDIEAPHFIVYTQNHDQIANSACGERLQRLTSPGRYRAITAAMLLAPGTPMLFQGQEFAASSPFLYFADHEPKLAELVAKGRVGFLEQFPSLCDAAIATLRTPPHDVRAFERSKLDFAERETNREAYDLVKELLRLRREDEVFSAQRSDWLHGAVIGPEAFALRYVTTTTDRLVLVNLGNDVDLAEIAEPLLAAPPEGEWQVLFSTEDPRFGGRGTAPLGEHGHIVLAGGSTLVLAAPEVKR